MSILVNGPLLRKGTQPQTEGQVTPENENKLARGVQKRVLGSAGFGCQADELEVTALKSCT
jgi:hypothetical protein